MTTGPTAHLHLLGGFRLAVDGEDVDLPPGSQRVVAFVGAAGGTVAREAMQGNLWPDRDRRRSAANLRSALWRVPAPARWVVEVGSRRVALASSVRCDVAELVDGARAVGADGSVDVRRFLDDLLPAWYEDWVLVERERLRQLRIHALERLALTLTEQGSYAQALEAALAAVAAEPLRETAQRCLIGVHVAEGNVSEAIAQYERYRRLLLESLGVEPGPALRDLMSAATHQ
jgi:DNA-binding SARP family transcriptional activator